MFRIKICGVTRLEDAQAAEALGADAVGLNFWPQSRRYVRAEVAASIAASLEPRTWRVGVFVNAPMAEVAHLARLVGLSAVQLHGDEQPEQLLDLSRLAEGQPLPVLRAFRVGSAGLAEPERFLARCQELGAPLPAAVLFDAPAGAAYGGTGQVGNWEAASQWTADASRPPLILAGGLTLANVAEAVRQVRPWGVDTASGVESAPGVKDYARMRSYLTAAAEALDRWSGRGQAPAV